MIWVYHTHMTLCLCMFAVYKKLHIFLSPPGSFPDKDAQWSCRAGETAAVIGFFKTLVRLAPSKENWMDPLLPNPAGRFQGIQTREWWSSR